jgi:phage gp36-like protein
MAYITLDDLQARLPQSTLLACLDWSRRGRLLATDPSVVSLLDDASSIVDQYIEAIYKPWPLEAPYPPSIKRLTYSAAYALLAQKYPTALQIDGYKMMDQVHKELLALRKQVTTVGKEGPDPAQNQGGETFLSGNDPNNTKVIFTDDFGSW